MNLKTKLTEEEMDTIVDRAKKFAKIKRNRKSNHPFDDRNDGEGLEERMIEGFMGEKGIANLFGVEYNASDYKDPLSDGGHDVVINGHRVDVKSTQYEDGNMIVKRYLMVKEDAPDYYFFAVINIPRRTVHLKGWLPKDQVKWRGVIRNSKGVKSYWVHQMSQESFEDSFWLENTPVTQRNRVNCTKVFT